jgi:hypothetical protein
MLDQCKELNFNEPICLSHYNEPLMDDRIIDIAKLVKAYKRFPVYFVTNGDLLTENLAKQLDGLLDGMTVSLYEKGREKWIQSLFVKTPIKIKGEHIRTHFVPKPELLKPVWCRTDRLIINHRRQYLLCCEDVVGNFNLGTFPEISLHDYWFGQKHKEILESRSSVRRSQNVYCSICPRIL